MKQQLNVRASALTIGQLNWLAARWGANQTETITVAVDRAYREERKMITINLYEDNAGRIFIGEDAGPWWDVTGAADASFDDDATAIVSGDTDSWTVERLDAEPVAPIVATWEDGALAVTLTSARQPAAGIAARRYLGLTW